MTDANPKAEDNNGRTPLSLAAEKGDERAVKLLLERGDVDLNVKDNDGRTPLLLAVANVHTKVAELLLEKDGVDPDTPDQNGRTPLSWGAGIGYWEVVELLVKKDGIDCNSQDNNGRTPLSWALGNGRWYEAKLLLAKDANPNIADNSGRTPLSWAAERGTKAVVELLLEKGANPNTADNNSRTPLLAAAEKWNEVVVELLLEKNANPNIADNNGRTPLLVIADKENKAVVELLLEKGADVQVADKDGRTPLLAAAEKENKAVVELLLERDANPNTTDNNGQTPLLRATERKSEAIIKLLLERGANPNTTDNQGQTPLLLAAKNRDEAVVELLLEKGADPNVVDKDGWTPLLWVAESMNREAKRRKREAEMKGMEDDMSDSEDDMSDSEDEMSDSEDEMSDSEDEMSDSDNVIKYLEANREGWEAEKRRKREDKRWKRWKRREDKRRERAVIELLLERGADPNTADNNSRTPLLFAVKNRDRIVIKLLLEKGADPNVVDKDGRTPLLWVAEMMDRSAETEEREAEMDYLENRERERVEQKKRNKKRKREREDKRRDRAVIELLLERGADPNTADNSGQTPRSWLVERLHHKFLLEKDLIKPAFSLTDIHWAPEFAALLSNETWELILKHMPEDLRWNLEYAEPYRSRPCWTLTPSSFLSLDSIPLTIAGAPVIIPVSYRSDFRPALSPPPDPRPEFISPSIPLKQEVIDAIFDTYDNPIGFYVLANGWLQIIVNEDFDSTYALSHRPQTFGGLRVSYIQQTIRPCVSRTGISPSVGTNQSSASTTPPSQSATSCLTRSTPMIRVGGEIEAKVTGPKKINERFKARIGVMTKCEDRQYVTVSTHLMTEAWLSTRKAVSLDASWKDDVKLYSACGTINDAHIAHTFDPEANVFPNGFLHDTSLIEVSELPGPLDALRCPYPADWLSDAEWSKLRPGDSSKLHLLDTSGDDSKETVKNIPFEESENMMIGQAIFNTRNKGAKVSRTKRVWNRMKGAEIPTANLGFDDWTDYVARALLFRLGFGMSTVSGTALCVLEKQDNGSKRAKIAGFTSFVQGNYVQTPLSARDDLVKRRLMAGNLAFYGAFFVPDALKKHTIL